MGYSPLSPRDDPSSVYNRDDGASVVPHVNRETILLMVSRECKQGIDAVGDFRCAVKLKEELRGH